MDYSECRAITVTEERLKSNKNIQNEELFFLLISFKVLFDVQNSYQISIFVSRDRKTLIFQKKKKRILRFIENNNYGGSVSLRQATIRLAQRLRRFTSSLLQEIGAIAPPKASPFAAGGNTVIPTLELINDYRHQICILMVKINFLGWKYKENTLHFGRCQFFLCYGNCMRFRNILLRIFGITGIYQFDKILIRYGFFDL